MDFSCSFAASSMDPRVIDLSYTLETGTCLHAVEAEDLIEGVVESVELSAKAIRSFTWSLVLD